MSCEEAREILCPIRRPRLVEHQTEEARKHVAGCPACRSYLAQDQLLTDAYERIRTTKAPLALRERIYTTIARERERRREGPRKVRSAPRPRRPRPVPAREERARFRRFGRSAPRPGTRTAAAAALVLVSGALLWQALPRPEPVSGASFVDDYLRRAVSQDRILSSDPNTVRQWLARELGMALRPLSVAGLEIESAEICLLEGRRGAMIVYRIGGTRVAHYLVPREEAKERPPTVSQPSGEPGSAAPPLVTWATGSVEQALVGELESSQLIALARSGS